ncbi:PepSY domain-containing protein [Peribacillus simplex]|uniref:PepSY domain-containing protein n=1 Tax=Peribacillus simplex TaxID=1478 RepID=UPI0007771917|nr:PepSY domain-containing protein [Peribacillus simplex]AMM91652.1 hypothetical protein UP17_02850 [Peribacillus simplex]MDM5296413.1 PepSY domain-containing protein [Peribacillus simplex]
MSKSVKLYHLSKKVHKWSGLILSVFFMFIAVTGLLLVYMIPLGVADELRTGKGGESKSIDTYGQGRVHCYVSGASKCRLG